MQTTISPPPPAKPGATTSLVNLSARVLELALKLRVGAVRLTKDIRPFVEGLLRQLDEDGVKVKCPPAQVNEVKFALVAYFDETVLELSGPLRDAWAARPLQLDYTPKNWAGSEFFKHLNRLLEDVGSNADVIEVYYLCLLLGFKGEYGIGLNDDDEELLRGITDDVAEKLRAAGRLTPNALSGRWRANDQPPPPRAERLPAWVTAGLGALIALTIFTYLVLYRMLPQLEITR